MKQQLDNRIPSENGSVSPVRTSVSARRKRISSHYSALLQHICVLRNFSGESHQTIGLTSIRQNAGVSTIATNLAIESAQSSNQDTLLIDANFGDPSIAKLLKLPSQTRGMADVLTSGAEVDDCLLRTSVPRLSVLSVGNTSAMSEAFTSRLLPEFIGCLQSKFDLVIVDLPPADALSTCYTMAGLLDGVILVLESNNTNQKEAERAKQRLVDANANVVGVVLNKQIE